MRKSNARCRAVRLLHKVVRIAALAGMATSATAFAGTPATADKSPVTFDCVIEPSLTLKLGSPVASILEQVEVDRGDHVKQGQTVARLESAVERAAVALNEVRARNASEVEAKQAVLELKRGVLARKQRLKANNYASAQDIDTAEAEFNVAEQDLAAAKSNRRLAELELQRSEATLEQRIIHSPIDGVVVRRSLGPGEYVHPEGNILTVARIDPLYVETFLPIRYFGQIEPGDTAIVRPDDPIGGERAAAVKIVDQVFDAASGTFGVRLELPNPEKIVPAGLRCRVRFEMAEPPRDGPTLEVGQRR